MSLVNMLLLGLIIGWLIEWLIDWFLWRPENKILADQLAAAQIEIDRLQTELQATRAQLKPTLLESTAEFDLNEALPRG